MTTEDRLRRAITNRTDHVEPASGGLDAIEETLMQPTPMSPRNKWLMGGAAAVLVALVAVAAIAVTKDDDSSQGVATEPAVTTTIDPQVTVSTEAPPQTATTTPPTTDPTATTVPGGTILPMVEPSSVVWPRPGHEARFDDPVDAARSFAVFYAGFTDPVVGPFRGGDNRSGEVEVRPYVDFDGPITTVLVRIMDDEHWYVIGALTPDIDLDDVGVDGSGAVTCPGTVSLTGLALAFEGQVDVRIDSFGPDGSRNEIGRGVAMGAGVPPAAPFEADIECGEPISGGPAPDTGGVMMLSEDSSMDGQRLAVTALPVSFPDR